MLYTSLHLCATQGLREFMLVYYLYNYVIYYSSKSLSRILPVRCAQPSLQYMIINTQNGALRAPLVHPSLAAPLFRENPRKFPV
jgi:hypothetical protein